MSNANIQNINYVTSLICKNMQGYYPFLVETMDVNGGYLIGGTNDDQQIICFLHYLMNSEYNVRWVQFTYLHRLERCYSFVTL